MEKMNEAFCVACGEHRQYTVNTTRETVTIKGTTFSYLEQSAHCITCGEEVYIPELNDANVQAREDAYRKASRLITITEIREILDKYNIGAGPLAKLLGLGDVTINRYLCGQLPSREISEKLLKVRSSHKEMEKCLENGRGLITDTAYHKCRAELDKLNSLYGSKKIELVARYILCNCLDITPLALQKLLYYSQAFFRALYGEEIFTDDCQAWAYGPVFPEVYYLYRQYGYDPIEMPTSSFSVDLNELTTREVGLLDAVLEAFGRYSGSALSIFTHNEHPWIEARGSLQPEDRSVTIINRDTINAYFSGVVAQYQINSPRDIKHYSDACRAWL